MFNKIKIIVIMCGKESKHYKLAVTYYGQAQKEWDANKKKFVHNADEMPLQGFNIVKNAARSN